MTTNDLAPAGLPPAPDDEPEVPKRPYVPRVDAVREWLQKKAPVTITPAALAKKLGWPTGAAQKALQGLEKHGEVVKVGRGTYSTVGTGEVRPKPPKIAKATPPADPYAVVDAVLENLFPSGVRVGHLTQVIQWRELTKALLELMEAK